MIRAAMVLLLVVCPVWLGSAAGDLPDPFGDDTEVPVPNPVLIATSIYWQERGKIDSRLTEQTDAVIRYLESIADWSWTVVVDAIKLIAGAECADLGFRSDFNWNPPGFYDDELVLANINYVQREGRSLKDTTFVPKHIAVIWDTTCL